MSVRLTTLKVRGLKAQNREIELEPVTILEGDTGAGKTTVLQAISIAMYGVDPRLGKSLDSMRPLLAESDVSISLADDSGFSVVRKLNRNSKGALSCVTSVYPPRGEQTKSDSARRVESEWGQLTVFVDVAEFLDQSPDRRRAFIANLAAAAGVTATNEQLVQIVTHGVRLQSEPVRERALELFNGLLPCFDSTDVQAGVARSLRELALQLSRSTAEKSAAEKATDDLRRDLLTSPATSLTTYDLQESLDSLVSEMNVIQSDLGGAYQQQKDRVRTSSALRDAQSELERLSHPVEAFPGIGDVQAELEEAESMLSSHKEALAFHQAEVAARSGAEKALKAQLTGDRKIHAVLTKQIELNAVAGEPCKLANWLGCKYSQSAAIVATAEADLRLHNDGMARSRAALEEASQQLAVSQQAAQLLALAVEEGTLSVIGVRAVVLSYTAALHGHQVAEATREAILGALVSQIALLEEEVGTPIPDVELLLVHKLSVDTRLEDLKEQMRSVAHREGVQIAKCDAEVRITQSELDVASLVALRDVLGPSGLQGTITKQLLAPLEQAANSSFLAHLPYGWRLTFVTKDDKGNDILDFALMKDQSVIRWSALSTGEELTAAVALVMGLLELVKPPLRVLLVDNLTLIDMKNRLPFVMACYEMVKKGALDTVIIASNEPLSIPPMDGLKTINLTE